MYICMYYIYVHIYMYICMYIYICIGTKMSNFRYYNI